MMMKKNGNPQIPKCNIVTGIVARKVLIGV